MPVRQDADGRRRVQLDVEVPGTPEQVWQAIATGQGISSWFAPTEVEEREGGAVAFHLGPGMDSHGRITAWEPPSRIALEEADWGQPGAPPLATEFIVQARDGGTCTLRVVHSLFASTEEWDAQLESMESGWPSFFEVLKLYLGRFAGQPTASVRVQTPASGSEMEAWTALTRALGLERPSAGMRPAERAPGLPPFDGSVERVGVSKHREMLVQLEQPATGLGLFGVYTWDNRVLAMATLYFYGPEAAACAAREQPRWQGWMSGAPFAAKGS